MMWGGMWWDRIVQDVRYGIRTLRRDPGFTLAAVVILTVGIGANVIVFTLAKGIFLDAPPAVSDPSELASVTWTYESDREAIWSYHDYAWMRGEASAFSGLMAYLADPLPTTVVSASGSAQGTAWVVSDNFFDVLGSSMSLGRGFLPEEGLTPGSHPVVVLSHGFWERYFGADVSVLGRSLTLNGTPFVVVGVTQPDFRGISPVETPPDVYVPIMMQGALMADAEQWFQRREGEWSTWYRLVGRLGDGVSVESAQAEVESLKAIWDDEFAWWVQANEVAPFRMGVSADYRFSASESERLGRMITFLGLGVGIVMFIGCANLALLLLARAPVRQEEMSVRAALGAGRFRIVRQLLTEAALLAAIGGLGGLVVAYWGSALVAAMMPYSFAADFTPDAAVLLFTGAVTVGVTAVFSLMPALKTAIRDVAGVLRGESRGTSRSRGRNVLVVGQVAASMVLLAGAGLCVRSLLAARSVDLGFEADNALVMSVGLANHGYDEARGRVFVDEVLDRAKALPGVVAASVTRQRPLTGRWTSTIRPEGVEDGSPSLTLYFNRAGPDYFEAMGIPIVEGRAIGVDDVPGAPPVLVLNETTAQRLWPGQEVVGKTIEWRDRTWTVVGIAADAKYYTIGDEPVSQVYVPPAQDFDPSMNTFVVRTSVPPAGAISAVEAVIRGVDDAVAVSGAATLRDLVDAQTSTYRAMAVLAATFGAIALFLATVGLYGVLTYVVSQSSREIGIRMALGARSGDVASRVLMRGSALALVGTVIGLAIAWALSGVMGQMLFGVEPHDPLTLSVVAAVLLAVTVLASYLPARRAARMNPMAALRDA